MLFRSRFAYLAVLAPIGLIACGGALVFERGRFAIRVVLTSGLLVIAAILARQTSRIIPVWRDEETLWRHVLQYYPTASLPHFHIALALVDQRRLAEALPHAEYASQEIPDNALARSTTGLLYLKAGRYAEARRELLAAVTIDPNLWAARYNLACAETGLGNLAKAVKLLQEVLTAQPQYRDFLRRDPALKSLRNDPSSALALQHWLAAP